MYVAVPVTTLWTSARAPRELDAAAVADEPDVAAWLELLDATPDGRLGLHGRSLTQLELGEPVEVLGDASQEWVEVVCPWQPSSLDSRGYPGWLPTAHLRAQPPAGSPGEPSGRGTGASFLEQAGAHVGLRYLWGGMSTSGLDCSGLVHHAMREVGVVVPRDADDQHDACAPVALEEVQPGDLYFFAREGRRAHHVGIVTVPGRMLHAPESDGRGAILEEPLDADRRATLVGAGRFPGAPHAG